MKGTPHGSTVDRAILVVDGTGRGHAICDLFARTDRGVTVFYGPGCDLLDRAPIISVPSISLEDPQTVLEFLAAHPVELTVVSNIDALSRGLVDVLREHGHAVIGPTRAAAELEASKERGKRFCVDHALPTAPYRSFSDPGEAKRYIRSLPYACVVKVDGLTPNGDGAVVCETVAEAEAAVDEFAATLGPQAFRVIVEQRLHGQEISVFALLDGESYLMFPTALDFKRALAGDKGKNCDGMGSIAPHPANSVELGAEIRKVLLEPLVRGLRRDQLDYTGFVYIGAMLTERGLQVIEINARFGDSEAQVVLPGVHSNFTELCRAVLAKELHRHKLVTDGLARCSVALTQGRIDAHDQRSLPGWPFGALTSGQRVEGLADVDSTKASLFLAHVRRGEDGLPVTCGGRVVHVVGVGGSLSRARHNAYTEAARITFRGIRYRPDIGAPIANATLAVAERAVGEHDTNLSALRDGAGTIIERCESAVRTYSRSFPAVFTSAKDDTLISADGTRYLDFLAGAGSLNYGHNPNVVKRELIEYIEADGLTHGLDLATTAKAQFLEVFQQHILGPRGLEYKVQFCSPSGTNAVEAALKLARLVTGRTNVVSFSGGFHGVSTGALSATGSGYYKNGLHASLPRMTHVPYPRSPHGEFDSLDLLRRLVSDPSSGLEKPAAVLVETVQGEGGIYVAPTEFLQDLRAFCDEHDILLIVDDIQAGCGRTGTFFSFERAGIRPDLVTLAKSISGYGLPMAVVLVKPELDIWNPGQHNGTFRGNQLAFVAGAAVIRHFWADERFAVSIQHKGQLVAKTLQRQVTARFGAPVRGAGLMLGIDLGSIGGIGVVAGKVAARCFDRGLIVETCGRDNEVIKLLPPLTISEANLLSGVDTIVTAITKTIVESGVRCSERGVA